MEEREFPALNGYWLPDNVQMSIRRSCRIADFFCQTIFDFSTIVRESSDLG